MTQSKYAFNTRIGIKYFNGDDIMYFHSIGSQTHIFITKGNKMFTSKSIKEIEKIIDDNYFAKINSSYIVNINHIQDYCPKNSKSITMTDGEMIEVSSNKKKRLLLMIKSISKI